MLSLIPGSETSSVESAARTHRLPLGLLMLSRGVIDETQLKMALGVQSERPTMKIGRCLETLGAVTAEEVTRALGAQHCLPVLLAFDPDMDSGVPLTLLEASRCVAFRGKYHPGLVYLGFDGGVDRSLVQATELVLGTECEPCIVETAVIEEYLELRRQRHSCDEVVFATRSSTLEILRSIESYIERLRADAVRIASTREYLWVLLTGLRTTDLLFRFR